MSSSFPKKEQRQKCYASRDQFWNCLDKFPDPEQEDKAMEACKKFKELFETDCPAQWVTHFNRKYRYLKFKEKIETGFDPIENSSYNESQSKS